MDPSNSMEKLVYLLRQHIGRFKNYRESGKVARAEKLDLKTRGIFASLRSADTGGIAALRNLMEDQDPWVRYFAARELLDSDPSTAEPVLRDIQSSSRGALISVLAGTTLWYWEKGSHEDVY